MGLKYTEEKLNSLDKETIIQLFLSQQEQLESINQNLRLVLEQMADLKRHRFGRSTERHVKIAVLAHTARSTRAILPKQESHLAGWLNSGWLN